MGTPIRHRGKWRIRWIDATGNRRSEVHVSHNEAAHALRLREIEALEIRSGQRPPTPPAKTFNDLCDYWLEHRAPRKRSCKHDESIIRAHLRPAFGSLPLRLLTVEEGDKFINARGHLDRKTVANHVTLLITMLNVAKDLGWITAVPRIRKPRISISQSFAYLQTADEVRRFLEAARHEGELVHALYATAVWTGLRAGELACLEWSDVDLGARLICVQRSFHGPTKSDAVRHVPILNPLLDVLRAWRLQNPLPIVFPNNAGRRLGESARVFQEVLHRVLDAAGFPRIMRRGKLRPFIYFHQLRHTFASHWIMLRGDLFKLQRILGHKTLEMTMRYAHLAPDAFAPDHARFDQMATPAPGRVFKIPKVRATPVPVRTGGLKPSEPRTSGASRNKSKIASPVHEGPRRLTWMKR